MRRRPVHHERLEPGAQASEEDSGRRPRQEDEQVSAPVLGVFYFINPVYRQSGHSNPVHRRGEEGAASELQAAERI